MEVGEKYDMSVYKEGGWQLHEEAETVTHPLKDLKDSQMNRKGPLE